MHTPHIVNRPICRELLAEISVARRAVAKSYHVMRLGERDAGHDEHAFDDLFRRLLAVVRGDAEHRLVSFKAQANGAHIRRGDRQPTPRLTAPVVIETGHCRS